LPTFSDKLARRGAARRTGHSLQARNSASGKFTLCEQSANWLRLSQSLLLVLADAYGSVG